MINTECHRYKTHSCNEVEYTHICKLFKYRLKNADILRGSLTDTFSSMRLNKMNKNQKCHIKKTTCKILFSKKDEQSDKILICYQTRPKLKTLLLTKKKLHAKLASNK